MHMDNFIIKQLGGTVNLFRAKTGREEGAEM